MKKVLLAIVLVTLVIISMSSCRTGYGCRGRESWGHMVRRINSQ